MGAPEGNQFWKLRSKHGRDTLFATPEKMWEAACEYFEWVDSHPYEQAEQRKGNISVRIESIEEGSDFAVNDLVYLPKMRPYTLHGLCRYLDCNVDYFTRFEIVRKERKDQDSKDFCSVITRIREIIYEQKYSGAASGFFNPNIIARDLGLTDKQEIESKKIKVTKKKPKQ